MPFNRVPTCSNIGEPGGHLPHGENCVGSLLIHRLSESARSEHKDNLLKGSHWPDQIDRAERNRREIIVFEAALAPVITVDDHAMFKNMGAQINLDIDAMVLLLQMERSMSESSMILLELSVVTHLTM